MSNFNWGYPNTVWFGNGRIKYLPKACKVLGIKNPLFVTDKDLAKTKMFESTLEINKIASSLPVDNFDLCKKFQLHAVLQNKDKWISSFFANDIMQQVVEKVNLLNNK